MTPSRVLLASPLGFLIGVSLGALGAGGSILAVPVLVFLVGQAPAPATSTSLVVVGTASMIGMVGHWRAGRVRVTEGIWFGVVGVGGSLAGSALNRRLDGDVLLLAFAVLILVAAWRMLSECPSCTRRGEERGLTEAATSGVTTTLHTARAGTAVKLATAGTAVGFLTGLFGVGGGFVIVPALTVVVGFPVPEAVGTSLLVIVMNSGVALATRMGTTGIDWSVALPFTLAAAAGAGAGKRVADHLPADAALRWFAGVLVAVALYTGGRAVAGLLE